MNKYIIITDSSADLTKEILEDSELKSIQLDVIVEGEAPTPNCNVEVKDFYAKLREKKSATTAAVNIDAFSAVFDSYLAQGFDVLYLGFSSGLSGTFNAGFVAAKELSEKYPERKIFALDTLCASLGQGLLVYYAVKMKNNGADIETVRDFVEENKLKLCHWFTVDDLFFLKRGGRINAATAIVGSMLSIKPVLHVDNKGRLINVTKARGRKAAIDALFDKMKQTAIDPEEQTVFISHGDVEEDAEYLAQRIKTELGVKEVKIGYVGPVIGAHSGPGTLALFYLGTER
ncbi:MAG: DegV family protein [Ruminococcaceae bacterium]|nr:DegV family protein [Oscillospiraceae bacterium]